MPSSLSPIPLPQGMTDVDYLAIEAAVTETVRGRWFLAEFARRNRGAEVDLMLSAMGRLENLVSAQAQMQAVLPPLPSSNPSIRLMVQRIKEIAAALDDIARDMREGGLAARFWAAVDQQARAVAGLMRTGAPEADVKADGAPHGGVRATGRAREAPPPASEPRRLPRVDAAVIDPRLNVFSGLDGLPLAQKLGFFT